MNFKRLIRKNWIPILIVLIVLIILYYGNNLEAFQIAPIPKIGDKCISKTDKIDGKCPRPYSMNKTTMNCEYIYTVSSAGRPNGDYTCFEDERIGDFKCKRINNNYTCQSGYEKIGNMLCAKVGTIKCPKNFNPRYTYNTDCMKCPKGTYKNTPILCKLKDSSNMVKAELAQGTCSV
jgi:hypothetical protein